jgi:hypothetical protein
VHGAGQKELNCGTLRTVDDVVHELPQGRACDLARRVEYVLGIVDRQDDALTFQSLQHLIEPLANDRPVPDAHGQGPNGSIGICAAERGQDGCYQRPVATGGQVEEFPRMKPQAETTAPAASNSARENQQANQRIGCCLHSRPSGDAVAERPRRGGGSAQESLTS